jgi:hypothetical protein
MVLSRLIVIVIGSLEFALGSDDSVRAYEHTPFLTHWQGLGQLIASDVIVGTIACNRTLSRSVTSL